MFYDRFEFTMPPKKKQKLDHPTAPSPGNNPRGKKSRPNPNAEEDFELLPKTYKPQDLLKLKSEAIAIRNKNRDNGMYHITVCETNWETNGTLTAGYLGFKSTNEMKEWVESEGEHSSRVEILALSTLVDKALFCLSNPG
jgi:hypothetical protein